MTKGSATNAHPAGASPEAMAQRTRHRTAGSKGPIGMSVGDAVEVCEHLQLLLPLVGIQGSCQRNAKLFLQLCWSESKKHTSGSLLQCEVLKVRRMPR